MNQQQRRRRTTILLLILLLIGCVITALVISRLLTTTAPDDSAAAGECTRLTFDQVPLVGSTQNIPTTEDMQISNQYLNNGYSFRNGPRFDGTACDRALPFIAKQGDPFRSFGNNALDLSDMPTAGQTFGPSWLTNQSWDGTEAQRNRPCSLEIVFDPNFKSNAFSFDILDLDYGERWIVEAFANAGDTTPLVSQNVNATNDGQGDGRARRVEMSSNTLIGLIRIRPAILQKPDGGSWGLGFDNFAGYCINAPVSICGNGRIETGEVCDDANTRNGDGCSATCQMETIDPARCFNIINISVPSSSSAASSAAPMCPNGIVEAGEQCDDGNSINGDGCSSTCRIDQVVSSSSSSSVVSSALSSAMSSTTTTTTTSTTSAPMCPNGIQDAGEECDDGNMVDTDSCSNTCELNPLSSASTSVTTSLSSASSSEEPISTSTVTTVVTTTTTTSIASVTTSTSATTVSTTSTTSIPASATTGGTNTTTGSTTNPGLPDTAIWDDDQGLLIWLGLTLILGGVVALRTRIIDLFLASWAEVTDFRTAQKIDFENAVKKKGEKKDRD